MKRYAKTSSGFVQNRRAGFALIELPLFLLIFAIIGLMAVGAFQYFCGSLPWYIWLIGPAVPVIILFVCVAISVSLEKRGSTNPERKRH